MTPEDWRELMRIVYIPGCGCPPTPEPKPTPDWQTAKIDACIDSMEMQMMGTRL